MEDGKHPKLFGVYNEIVILFIGFLLTTGLGTFLTYKYQSLAAESAQEADTRRSAVSDAKAVFDDVSRLMDARLFKSERLMWAEEMKQDEVLARRVDYTNTLVEWNMNFNRNASRIQLNFGCQARQQFSQKIQSLLSAAHKDVMADRPDTAGAKPQLISASKEIDFFDKTMLWQIRHENVGALMPENAVTGRKDSKADLECPTS